MTSRRLLAACALVALSALTPAHADEVDDLLTAVGATAYDVTQAADQAVQLAHETAPRRPSTATVGQFNANTDYITIADDGAGPVITYYGTFSDRSLWSCNRIYGNGGGVLVACDAVPGSGFTWQCGIMNVSATALPRYVDVYDWARDEVRNLSVSRRAQALPDHRNLRYGRVVGSVSCNNDELVTEQANKDNPERSATRTMGPVSRLMCNARLTQTMQVAAEPAYLVVCVDPANPAA